MMNNKFNYLGYKANIEFSIDDQTFVGVVQDIDALIMFSGDSIDDLQKEFTAAVDEYIATCERDNIAPGKAHSGTINVRVGGDLHRAAYQTAKKAAISLNEFVRRSIQSSVEAAIETSNRAPDRHVGHHFRYEANKPLSIREWAEPVGDGEPEYGVLPGHVRRTAPKLGKEWN